MKKIHKFNILFIFLITNFFLTYAYHIQDYKDLFEHKKILITGGSGYIGKALINEILKFNPNKIVIFSRDEVKHSKLLEDLNSEKIISILGDIRNYESIYHATKNIDIVIHAAALKRIDILEYNVFESIYTNVIGTMNVAKACIENKVKTALLVSTDKACSPVNTYGACKFISERIFTNMFVTQDKTRFLVVRYGNVLQSTGSAIPFFCEKIKNNQIVPLTSEKMTRFFISKEQAVEHIFKTIKYGLGGETFIPSLPSFKIVDLIYALQKKLGQTAKIQVTGLRPGEKIHEIMINTLEVPRTYKFNNMFVIISMIKKHDEEALYKKDGQLLNVADFIEYSSNDSLLSVEDLHLFLEKNNIVYEKTTSNKKYGYLEL